VTDYLLLLIPWLHLTISLLYTALTGRDFSSLTAGKVVAKADVAALPSRVRFHSPSAAPADAASDPARLVPVSIFGCRASASFSPVSCRRVRAAGSGLILLPCGARHSPNHPTLTMIHIARITWPIAETN
jgi:hypothetical protein